MMRIDEVRAMSSDDLLDELEDLKAELYRLRFQKETGQLEDVNLIRYNKRTVGRIKMVLRERQIAAEAEESE